MIEPKDKFDNDDGFYDIPFLYNPTKSFENNLNDFIDFCDEQDELDGIVLPKKINND